MRKVRNKRRSHAETLCLSISALYSKQRDPQTLRAARLLRMTDEMSFRSVSTPVIPQCLYAGYRSFLLRPILRIQTLRNDEAAGVRGFTLVELLVVVLIIGILSAIAIPMYQGAVDKSHWSTMLPASKAIKDAQEAIKMTNGYYTPNMQDLDVTMDNGDLTFDLQQTPSNGIDADVIRVTNSKLGDNVRLASYLDDSPKFASQLHCEAKTGDERGTKLCEKLLGGQELTTVGDYTGYLLDQAIDKATCDNAERSWSNNFTKCFRTERERCEANEMNPSASTSSQAGQHFAGLTSFCGYAERNNVDVKEGGMCAGRYSACQDSTFNNATCVAGAQGCDRSDFTNHSVCIGSNTYSESGCRDATFDNSICVSRYIYGSCQGSSFTNGSICYAQGWVYADYGGCAKATYDETSCCCGGSSCPDKYRCAPDRCDAKWLTYSEYGGA